MRFCEDVNHFTKHLAQLIMANKNRLNLPVFVGVFLRLMTSPNLPRSQELTAMIGLLGLLSLVNPTSCGWCLQKTWLHQGEMCRNVIFRGAGGWCHEQWKNPFGWLGTRCWKKNTSRRIFIMIYHKGVGFLITKQKSFSEMVICILW